MMNKQKTLEVIEGRFAVCKLATTSDLPWDSEYVFISRTKDEISLVCTEASIPSTVLNAEKGYRAFRVAGPLEFSLTGILASIAGALADQKIPLFAVSTFDTDYILVKEEHWQNAVLALEATGYDFI